jgi:ABC-type polysaccharide/polyol phosphate export permease
MVLYDRPPAAPLLAYPGFLALQFVFTTGLALLVATWTAFFRDVKHFLEILLAALFWATPIVYPITIVESEPLRAILQFMPMSPFITAYHDIFFYGRWPDPLTWLLAGTYAAAAAGSGLWLMLKREDMFLETL